MQKRNRIVLQSTRLLKRVLIGLGLLMLFPAAAVLGEPTKTAFEVRNLIGHVDPFIGAKGDPRWNGNCVVGPIVPFGSVNPSPDTHNGNTDGYSFDEKIRGFSQTHVSGTGGGSKYGNFLLSPQIGLDISKTGHDSAKAGEVAVPAYYAVDLTDYKIRTEITASHHAAIYRLTFPSSTNAHIMIDCAHQIPGDIQESEAFTMDGSVVIDTNRNTISGWTRYYGGYFGDPFNIYFCAEFSKAPLGFGTWKNGTVTGGADRQLITTKGDRVGAYVGFVTSTNEQIFVKIGISFVSVARAKQFLHDEIPNWDFDAVRSEGESKWNKALSTVLIDDSTATSAQLKLFYTALYHSMVMPHDRTGDNPWGSTEPYYDDQYCVWDTFRTQFPLLTLLKESVVRGNIKSCIERYRHFGRLSDTFVAGNECSFEQGGDDSDIVIADAYAKGISGIDWEKAYSVLKHSADYQRTPSYREGDRGWVPEGTCKPDPDVSCSKTLEYAYNDFCLATMAIGLGKTNDYQRYLNRSGRWENIWNSDAVSDGYKGFVQMRRADKSWVPCDYKKFTGWGGPGFYEATSWMYSYFVPHNMPRVISLMGGTKGYVDRLQYACEKGMIDKGNEPSFLTLRSFNYALRPDLNSYWVRETMKTFTETSYPGDDDAGAMSSWYVLSALGIFPNAGQDLYLINGPLFRKATIQMENGCNVVIHGANASPDAKYIQSATLNGAKFDRAWVKHTEIKNGATFTFDLGTEPSDWGRASVPPSGVELLSQ